MPTNSGDTPILWQVILLSGAGGAFSVYLIQSLFGWRADSKRRRALGRALRAEIKVAGQMARGYLDAGILSPLYRLPDSCFPTSFSGLCADGVFDEQESDALIRFYSEIASMNRGLAEADRLHSDLGQTQDRHAEKSLALKLENASKRTWLKAERIAVFDDIPVTERRGGAGELYRNALAVTDRWKS
jgi:hypothetical protein